ncbi:D-cysteine desulfhydrase family protein [Fervidibacter sacchari]|uniref:D-cysteine desulfhydrase family pyridoxal phosphate-dependent enzyme n=1 Tax=Candidatus Fervidibacter sacchari TaxID=1448929 RepID=A0ABT2EN18_9BACT|nr:D-cysteine desulfhydrase family protein [Candidatus Fervidibacter sacchari]MCS3919074.1 D-cysteine desulfhydrase family pyridoxal phosphate-dependent enzyme [Candidatus Fervidibacter sacchari]WKU17194.1 D-cysteine desulfhydrase family protein [Candidatus Fervidibacter sacchari]
MFCWKLEARKRRQGNRRNWREQTKSEGGKEGVVSSIVTEAELWERLGKLPRVQLGNFPTPLEMLPRISKLLGVQVFIKRDDLTGLAFGGNKTRHLEFGLGQAIHEGCDVVVNGAAVQSNYCRQTAAACAKLGLKCALVLRRNPEIERFKIEPQGNLLLDYLFGADIRFIGPDEDLEGAKERVADEYRAKGHKPFVIRHPDLSGGFGYLVCLLELVQQCRQLGIKPTHIVHSSSTPTQVGFVVGVKALGLDWQVLGVSPSHSDRVPERIAELSNLVAGRLGLPLQFSPDEIHFTTEFVGKSYGIPTPEAIEAMKLMAQMEGIVLDPVYTAKAFAAIVAMAKDGRLKSEHTVIFVHTGGTPALFAYQPTLVQALGLSEG